MRTFNGLQIFTEQLTNSGQLDLRYVRITGNQNISNVKNFLTKPTVNGVDVALIGEAGGGGSSFTSPPATSTSAGTQYNLATDSNYLYVCVATNTWVRTALASTWQ